MLAHLIRTQNRTQGPLEELSMVCMEGVNSKPYHNGSNPKVGMTGQRDIHWKKS